jgi:hypothetical protein
MPLGKLDNRFQGNPMSANDWFWNREELYEEVWATPMQALAKKYGISDVGLAKVCRKLSIPLPGRGYWARKAARQDVEQSALPVQKERIVLRKPTPRPEPPKHEDFGTEAEIEQLARIETTSGEVLLKRGSLSHPLIVQARTVLKRADPDSRKIVWSRESCLDVSVSRQSLDRALRIMAGIIAAIEEAGFSVSAGVGERTETIATIHGQVISFGLSETVDRIEIAAPPKGGLLETVLTYGGKPVTQEPSGRFSIEVRHMWGPDQKKWRDGKTRSLEEQLPAIVGGFIRFALSERAAAETRAAEEREKQRIAEERARLEASIKREQSKVRALRNAAANWSRAGQIRAFLSASREAAIQNAQPVDPGTAFGDWLVWASAQADRLDPLKESPSSIIDRKREEEPVYYYGYQKPEPPFRFPKPIWRVK